MNYTHIDYLKRDQQLNHDMSFLYFYRIKDNLKSI